MTFSYEKVLEKIVDNKKALYEQYKKELIQKMEQCIETFVKASSCTYFQQAVYVKGVLSPAELTQLKAELAELYSGFSVQVVQELGTDSFYGTVGSYRICLSLEVKPKKV